jgi:hypothetical protein
MFQNLPGDRWHIGINDTIDSLSIADTLEQNVITLRNMDGNRNVGIGNSLPQAKLDVSGEVKIGNTAWSVMQIPLGAIRYNSGKLQYCDNTSNWVWLQPAPTIVSGLFEGINYDCKDCGLSLTVNTQTWTYTYLASNPTKLANTIIFKTKYRGDIPQINNIKTVFAVPASSIDPGYDIDGGINVEVVRLQEHEFTISIGRLANQHEQPFSVSFIVVGE